MNPFNLSIKNHILIPITIALIVLLATFILSIFYFEQKNLDRETLSTIEKIKESLTPQSKEIRTLSSTIQQIQHDPVILKAWETKDREMLFQASKTFFDHLKVYHSTTHFHFIDSDKMCFLNMHAPSLKGDFINRQTLDEAAIHKQVSVGIEFGAACNVLNLRIVYPWEINGKITGYIEISKELDPLASKMSDFFNSKLLFCVDKRFVNQATWEEGNAMIGKKGDWNLFKNYVVTSATLDPIPLELIQLINRSSPSENKLKEIKLDHRSYQVGQIALMDAQKQQIGHLFILCDVTETKSITNKIIAEIMMVCCLVGIILFLLIDVRITKYEIQLTRTQNALYHAQEESQKANRAKSDFLAMISHDIRTPMNGVLGFTDLLLDTELNAEQHDYVQTIQSSGKTLLALLNDILDYSKIEANKLELEEKPFDPAEEIRNIIKLQKAVADIKGLELKVEIDADTPEKIVGDRLRFNQILSNFIGNALKFTDKGGVWVTTTVVKNELQPFLKITVRDTGIGISKEKFKLLFKPFSQLEQSESKQRGSGLGLAISKRLCEMMGGTIRMESEKDKGSTFEFSIPILSDNEIKYPHPATENERSLKGQFAEVFPLKILVAEDNPVNQKLMLTLLKRLGYQAKLVENGRDVLEQVKKDSFDLILMDIQMPFLSGLDATRKIRAGDVGEENKDIYICAVSALAMQGDREQCIEAGMNDYLSKPLNLDKLEEALQQISIKKTV